MAQGWGETTMSTGMGFLAHPPKWFIFFFLFTVFNLTTLHRKYVTRRTTQHRGCFSSTTTLSPPSLETQDRGGCLPSTTSLLPRSLKTRDSCFSTTTLSPHSLKMRDGGGCLSTTTLLPPLLKMWDGGGCPSTTSILPPLLKTQDGCFSTTALSPPSLRMRDGGGCLPSTTTPHSLPHSNHEMEGVLPSNHPHPPPSLQMQGGGVPPPPPPTFPRFKCKMEGFHHFHHLAPYARRRGSATATTPPSLQTQNGGIPPPPTFPRFKCETKGFSIHHLPLDTHHLSLAFPCPLKGLFLEIKLEYGLLNPI